MRKAESRGEFLGSRAFSEYNARSPPVARPRREDFLLMCLKLHRSLLAFAVCLVISAAARADDWPQFRGPGGQGHVLGHCFPLTWSEKENIAWKVPIPGLGWSSPVVQGSQIWLTTADDEGHSLRAICLDRSNGKVVHNVEVFHKDDPGPIHSKNSHASPTPVINGDRVFVHFGAHGTACLTTAGKIDWRNNELKYEHKHGPAGSPVVFEDLLLLSCDGTDVQFVVALDKRTGKIRWKKDRAGGMSYSTPLLQSVDGQIQLISTGTDKAIAYDPARGGKSGALLTTAIRWCRARWSAMGWCSCVPATTRPGYMRSSSAAREM